LNGHRTVVLHIQHDKNAERLDGTGSMDRLSGANSVRKAKEVREEKETHLILALLQLPISSGQHQDLAVVGHLMLEAGREKHWPLFGRPGDTRRTVGFAFDMAPLTSDIVLLRLFDSTSRFDSTRPVVSTRPSSCLLSQAATSLEIPLVFRLLYLLLTPSLVILLVVVHEALSLALVLPLLSPYSRFLPRS
jgi:hypothetical protein